MIGLTKATVTKTICHHPLLRNVELFRARRRETVRSVVSEPKITPDLWIRDPICPKLEDKTVSEQLVVESRNRQIRGPYPERYLDCAVTLNAIDETSWLRFDVNPRTLNNLVYS